MCMNVMDFQTEFPDFLIHFLIFDVKSFFLFVFNC